MPSHPSDISSAAAVEASLFGASAPGGVDTPTLISTMLATDSGISDLVFSPGRPPQVERHGALIAVPVPGAEVLRGEHTCRVSRDLLGGNEHALRALKEHGACDLSYSIPDCARFRVNVFRQRGTYAVVMRVIATKI